MSKVLNELESCGFIRAYTMPGKRVRGSVYQLIDNFTLFYFKFMSGGRSRRAGEWLSQCALPVRRVWNGLAFERVCLEHSDCIRRALGISGVRTVEHAWNRRGDAERTGAQIDLLIWRTDRAVNICEMKYASEAYVIDTEESSRIVHRKNAFIKDEAFTGSVFVTLIAPHGVVRNAAWNDIQGEVTLVDLFA